MNGYFFKVYWVTIGGEEHYSDLIKSEEYADYFCDSRSLAGCRDARVLIVDGENLVSDLLTRLNK